MSGIMSRSWGAFRNWRFWLGLLISLGSLVLLFRGVQFQELGSALRSVELVWLLPAVGLLVISLAVRAVRWRLLFFPQRGLNIVTLFHVINISFLINNVVPARAGDIVRAGLITTREPVSGSRALATIVVERLLDGITVVLLLVLVLPLFPVPAQVVRISQVAGVSFVGLGIGLIVLSTQRARSVRWAEAVFERVPRIDGGRWAGRVGNLVDGLQALRSPLAMGQAGVWSAVVWLLSALAYYCVLQAFDLGLSMAAGIFILATTTLVLIVPSTPGYVGVFDYAAVLVLSVFGVERNLALSCALVLHATTYLTFSGAGLISLLRESLSLSALIGERPQAVIDSQ